MPDRKPPTRAAVPPRRRPRAARCAAALAALAWSLAALAPRDAAAQGASEGKGDRKVVVWVEGGGAKDAEVKRAIVDKLPSTVKVVDDADFRREMVKAGQKLPFRPLLGKGPFRRAALDRTRKALAALGAEGAILGNIRIGKGGQEVVVLYIEARDTGEEPDVETPILLAGADVSARSGDALSAQIADWSGSPPPAEPAAAKPDEPKEEPAPDDEPAPKEEEPEAAEDGGRPKNLYGRELFSVGAAFDLGARWFSYNDGVTSNLRDYDVFGAPGFRLDAEVYPLAGTDVPVLSDLGIVGGFGMALGLSSETADGDEVSTQWMRFDAGLRWRIRTGGEKAPVLGLHGGFSMDRFDLEAEGALADEVPSVGYAFLRVGVDGRIPMGPVALALFFDYLGAVSAGDVYDRFTGSSIGGIALGGDFVVPIASGFEVRLGAEYDRWFYAFQPAVGDAFVAGGALDEYLHLSLGPAYVY